MNRSWFASPFEKGGSRGIHPNSPCPPVPSPAQRGRAGEGVPLRRAPLLAALLAILPLASSPAGAIPCPGDGAKLRVIINNPTASTGFTAMISGHQITGQATCVGASDSYSSAVDITQTGDNEFVIPVSRGLASGMWVHRISLGSQAQHQKGMVVFTSTPSDYTKVNWSIYPFVVTVNRRGDTSVGSCPPDCTFRQALGLATSLATLGPTLVQFTLSPGIMTQAADLAIGVPATPYPITIDGTNFDGDPKIVGDALAAAQGSQSPFPRALDLANKTRIVINSDDVTIKGLAILNSGGAPLNAPLVESAGSNTRIEAVRLDGGTGGFCETFVENFNLIVAGGSGPPSQIVNIEGRAARANGIRLFDVGEPHEVRDSWLHHNCASGVRADGAVLTRNMIELSGRQLGSNQLLLDEAVGITGDGNNDIDTNRNVVRNNAALGVDVEHGFFGLDLTNDYVCGNGAGGIVVRGNLVSSDAIGTGLAATYNADEVTIPVPTGHGLVFLDSFQTDTVVFDNDSAFTANLFCGLQNNSNVTVSALNNQWRGSEDPGDPNDDCELSVDFCTTGGTVECDPFQPPSDSDVFLDANEPAFPSNALLKGQTLRVQGAGFNAIAGNPLSTAANCALGASDVSGNNCCRKKSKANQCAAAPPLVPPPPPNDGSNCVALLNAAGQWQPIAVTSVTPTTIVAEVSSGGYACVGGMGEMVRVAKLNGQGQLREDLEVHCRNNAPF